MSDNTTINLIYILGNSHSGSTILGAKLSSVEGIHFVGELKKWDNIKRESDVRMCTCGYLVRDCAFWSKLLDAESGESGKSVGNDIKGGIGSIRRIISPQIVVENQKTEWTFLQRIFEAKVENDTELILDSSKSLWRLKFLQQIPNLNIYTIYLSRGLESNLYSFVKRKRGFWISLARIVSNDWLIERYLSNHKGKYMKVKYEDFVEDSDKVMLQIIDFVGVEKDYVSMKEAGKYLHVASGNDKTRNNLSQGLVEIRPDKIESIMFNRFQSLFLKVVFNSSK